MNSRRIEVMEYKIGDFSLLSRLTVKTLRYYHEIGLIVPARTDSDTGYRWYDEACLSRANAVRVLRDLGFSPEECREALAGAREDTDLQAVLTRKLADLETKMARDRALRNQIASLIHTEQGEEAMANIDTQARWAEIPAVHYAGIRFRGRYDQIGTYYSQLFRAYGRWVVGAPFALYHDNEFKEDDADIEACVPLRGNSAAIGKNGAHIGDLPAAKGVEVVHLGPYPEVGTAYKKLVDLAVQAGKKTGVPAREVYLKGPGMIFPRSPKKFVTLVQVPVSD